MNCLDNIIGISQSSCECFIQDLTPEEIEYMKKSNSGLYLDEIEGGIRYNDNIELSNCKSYFELQKQAIKQAISLFNSDLITQISKEYTKKNNTFFGIIGEEKYSSIIQNSEGFNFIKISPKNGTDAIIQLNKIVLYIDYIGSIEFKIIKKTVLGFEEIYKDEINIKEKRTELGINLNLKLKDNYNNNIIYYLGWESKKGANPLNNKIDCGCGGAEKQYKNYINIEGGKSDNIKESEKNDSYCHGVTFICEIGCNTQDIICAQYNRDENIKKVTAYAIQYKAGCLINYSILNSSDVNRYTMLDREGLLKFIDRYSYEYDSRVKYIAETINLSESNCYKCRSNNMNVSGILV